MKIQHTTIYVTDQEKAHRFYTEVLGFQTKADFSNAGFRWLTVVSPADPDGCQLQLAADDNPAGKAYAQALFAQRQPSVMFTTRDVVADCDAIQGRGGATMPPTDTTGSKIAQLSDGCGNLIQLTQLTW